MRRVVSLQVIIYNCLEFNDVEITGLLVLTHSLKPENHLFHLTVVHKTVFLFFHLP